ncbi:hypothetical protein [Dactylosporangium cerinum]
MYFVYRTHYEGPLSLRIRRLPDRDVLDWFRRGWDHDAPRDWIEAELGGPVYGLASIFEAARSHPLARPETVDELRTLLHEHLYVEGDADYIRLDGQSLRVRTDDDEVELAYFFLHDDLATARADRLAYLLHGSWPLPGDALPAGGAVTTYAVFLTHYDGETLARLAPSSSPASTCRGCRVTCARPRRPATGRRNCSCCGRSSPRTTPPSNRPCGGATSGRASTSTTTRGRAACRTRTPPRIRKPPS